MKDIYPELCGLLMRSTRIRHKINMNAISGLGIHPSEHFLLVSLAREGHAFSQTKLAEMLDVSPACVARTIKSLDASGYIKRNESEGDSRRNEIRITEKGRAVLEKSRRMFEEMDEEIYSGFSDEDLNCLHGLLSRMLENICTLEQKMKAREEME